MSGPSSTGGPSLEVFWRPGCPFCSKLRIELKARGVDARWRNIWEDPEALALVRAANHGDETVPTVRVGGRTLTNPSWRQLRGLLGDPAPARGRRGPRRGRRTA